MNNHTNDKRTLSSIMLFIGILLVACNLRAPFTGVAPVLDTIQSVLSLSSYQTGLLTTLPLLCFAVISPFVAQLEKRFGLNITLLTALVAIMIGILVRSLGWVSSLYIGTLLTGAGIAVGNTLLPSLVKQNYPDKVANMTGLCGLCMGVSAGLISATIVPLDMLGGWQIALGTMVILPLLGAVIWSKQLNGTTYQPKQIKTPSSMRSIWLAPLAWQITLFMGINSLLYYMLVAWLPTILTDAGFSTLEAGSVHGMMQLASALPGLFLGPIVSRMKNQVTIAIIMSGLLTVGLMGLWIAPLGAMLWVSCFGVGSGGVILLAYMFIGFRTGSTTQATLLSGMAQGVGYLLAASGPTLVGILHNITHNWTAVLLIATGLSVVMLISGALAGRLRSIELSDVEAVQV
ncbi:MFS transporter [Vibrio eleionomae]|uniref:MFS transporter n=1 Tax=Vibrio eleionomae TaxID=2653505 RepID=UPI001925ACB9|nr:MFS transporter [Vibrio eleionomae]